MADQDYVCYLCAKTLGLNKASLFIDFTCAGCGGEGLGAFAVGKLDDLKKQRCKNSLKKSISELLNGKPLKP